MSSTFPSFALLQNIGSANCPRPITTMSTLPELNISSACAGSLILPTPMVNIPVSFLILAALSMLKPLGRSIGGTSYLSPADIILPLDISSTSTPASFANLQNAITSSMVKPFSK